MADSVDKEGNPLAITDKEESGGAGVTFLDVNGEPVKLDALGPMIINSDGVGCCSWGVC